MCENEVWEGIDWMYLTQDGDKWQAIVNLITVQQDATYSVYYISVGSPTCFGCWHPSSEARTTVITASGID